jgi:hypothetical protein
MRTETDYLLHDSPHDSDGDHMDDCEIGRVNYYVEGAQKLKTKKCRCRETKRMTYCERTAQFYAKMKYKPLIGILLACMLLIGIYYTNLMIDRKLIESAQSASEQEQSKLTYLENNTTNQTYLPSPISASVTVRQQQFILVDSNRNYSSEVITCLKKYIISTNSMIIRKGLINTSVAEILNVSSTKMQYRTIVDLMTTSFNIGSNSVIVLIDNINDFIGTINLDGMYYPTLSVPENDRKLLLQNWHIDDKVVMVFAARLITYGLFGTTTYSYMGNSLLC